MVQQGLITIYVENKWNWNEMPISVSGISSGLTKNFYCLEAVAKGDYFCLLPLVGDRTSVSIHASHAKSSAPHLCSKTFLDIVQAAGCATVHVEYSPL